LLSTPTFLALLTFTLETGFCVVDLDLKLSYAGCCKFIILQLHINRNRKVTFLEKHADFHRRLCNSLRQKKSGTEAVDILILVWHVIRK